METGTVLRSARRVAELTLQITVAEAEEKQRAKEAKLNIEGLKMSRYKLSHEIVTGQANMFDDTTGESE